MKAHWGVGEIDGTMGNDKLANPSQQPFKGNASMIFVHFLLIQRFN